MNRQFARINWPEITVNEYNHFQQTQALMFILTKICLARL